MGNIKRNSTVAIGLLMSISLLSQAFTLTGSTYYDRCESFVKAMNSVNPMGANSDPKYTGPYFFSRLYQNFDIDNTNKELEVMYDKYLNNPSLYYNSTGSGKEFYPHATMHGYLLTKDKMTNALKAKIKSFLQLCDFNSRGGTLNLDMMINTSGFLAAEEWSDFKDKNGKTPEQIKAYSRPKILARLQEFINKNCEELDAYTYFPTNIMYVRMLAEFAKDPEVKQKAYWAYQQMVSGIVVSWNKGLYVNNPPRSKGWANLFTGAYASDNASTALGWLYFGNKEGFFKMIPCMTVSNNIASSVFWMTYKRAVEPIPELIEAEKLKTFPCVYRSVIEQGDNFKSRYSYQSENYGLCTQHEELKDSKNWNKSYTWKETKRIVLSWRSTVPECVFSVCQDNPDRPAEKIKVNALGYGENPFHRVLQQNKAAIGIYNVPTEYNSNGDKLYRVYVPFSKKGIQKQIEKNGWVICHTGSIMFAFKSTEPYKWAKNQYQIKNHDVLVLEDDSCRKGSWVLETTEISSEFKGKNQEEELNNFAKKLDKQTKLSTLDYKSENPRIQYKSLNGDLLDITYFPPTVANTDQYKVNGEVLPFNKKYLYESDVINQEINTGILTVKGVKGLKTINLNQISKD
jgi:hypothetical protein